MTKEQWKAALCHSAELIIGAKDELTQIDSRFGDADHGVTMEKIARAIQNTLKTQSFDTLEAMMEDVSTAVMGLNGGAAVPLWSTYLGGFILTSKDQGTIDVESVKAMFENALLELKEITTAKVGDKTMMDTIIPATEAILKAEGDIIEVLEKGAEAGIKGAKASEQFVAKFGRAKSYKEQTLGTPDAGAISAMYFFKGLSESFKS